MGAISYLKYFFYIAWHWNPIIAIHILFHEIKGEKKYGINTTGIDNLETLDSDQLDHATIYMPAIYSMLELVFEQTNISDFNHLLDIGCGKGRAICVAATKGCKKVSGIDFSKDLCMDALHNLTLVQQKQPALLAKIINADAYTYAIPTDVDCIFLFNPFDDYLMEGVVKNIQRSLVSSPRIITIIYANPLSKSLFVDAGFKETFYSKTMRYIEVSVLQNKL
jgi:SAM-dependent methyltransferase